MKYLNCILMFVGLLSSSVNAKETRGLLFSGITRIQNGQSWRFSGRLVFNPNKRWAGGLFFEGDNFLISDDNTRQKRHANAIVNGDAGTLTIQGNPRLQLDHVAITGISHGLAYVTYSRPNSACSRYCSDETYSSFGAFTISAR
jgi:hypothetical protein